MPRGEDDTSLAAMPWRYVVIDGRNQPFSAEVMEFLLV